MPSHGSRKIRVQEKDKAGEGVSWQHPPLLLETDLPLAPSQASYFIPTLSSRPSIQGPGLTVSEDENGQPSASPARPVGLVLCVFQHLAYLHYAHFS